MSERMPDASDFLEPGLKTRWTLVGDVWHYYLVGERHPVCGQRLYRTTHMTKTGATPGDWRCRPCRQIVADLRHVDADPFDVAWCITAACPYQAVRHIHDEQAVSA